MKIEPDYLNFKKRFFDQIKESVIIYFFVIVIIGLIMGLPVWKLLLYILLPIYFLFLLQSFFINKYCLKFIVYNELDDTIEIAVYKYDKLYQKYIIPCDEVNVSLHQVFYSILTWYVLKIYKMREKIFVQRENKMWSLKDLKKANELLIKVKKGQKILYNTSNNHYDV